MRNLRVNADVKTQILDYWYSNVRENHIHTSPKDIP